jgi:putative nucleotidyltransferase with HDIG domain
MLKIKTYFFKYFEQIVVLFILVAVVVLNYFVAEKLALLNLFFLPAIVAGFVLGQRKALLTSIFSVMAVTFYVFLNYDNFKSVTGAVSLYVNIISWGSFLILCAIVVGHLHEKNEKQIVQLKNAYMGILEILSKYIESSDKYTQGHSVRVSHYATEIAAAMNLEPQEIENIKVAALLHDVGKVDISTELIGKAASLSSEEMNVMASHSERGARILSSVSSVLSEAIPLVLAHHQYFDHDDHKGSLTGEVQLGAHILAVADSYDAMTTDRPYRSGMPPWKAMEELERGTGTQFNPEVVSYFKKLLFHHDGTHQILSGDKAYAFE